jgi:arylsulfatase A-like enzyme
MQGFKKSVQEGGIRNFLAVKGPGISAGTRIDSLQWVTDILPTMVQLAGISDSAHLPWDGISFADILLSKGNSRNVASLRLNSKNQLNQMDRYIVSFSADCWSPDSVPDLGPDRRVQRPQPLLNYDQGGVDGQGFQRCLGVRYLNYKWLGETNKVYR